MTSRAKVRGPAAIWWKVKKNKASYMHEGRLQIGLNNNDSRKKRNRDWVHHKYARIIF